MKRLTQIPGGMENVYGTYQLKTEKAMQCRSIKNSKMECNTETQNW